MLPAVPAAPGVPRGVSSGLVDLLPSMLDSVLGRVNSLGLPPVSKAVVVLVDGMGTQALKARAGHARTLAAKLSKRSTVHSGFPTTTAAALATLTTGTYPGEHGLVGYRVLDAAHDRTVNQLNGWDDRLDPATWQRSRTVFERATDAGVPSFVVGMERYRDSGFTRAILRSAEYRAAGGIAERMAVARDILDSTDRGLVYLYIPELDKAGHAHGCESPEWTAVLEEVDAAVLGLTRGLRRGEGVIVTADHGVLDVPAHGHVLVDHDAGLIDGIRFIAGEPRCLQLHFEPDATAQHREVVLDRWRAAEGGRAWIASREEAIENGWFGPRVHPDVASRIGGILVAARRVIAYYDSRVTVRSGRSMVGQHGSFTPAETGVPLLRLGGYAA